MKKIKIILILCHLLFLFSFFHIALAQEKEPSEFYDLKIETILNEETDIALITVTGKHGYHINIDYPWKLTINNLDGLIVEKHTYFGSDAETMTEEKAVFRIPFQADNNMIIKANLKLAVCKDIKCIFDDAAISWFPPTTQ